MFQLKTDFSNVYFLNQDIRCFSRFKFWDYSFFCLFVFCFAFFSFCTFGLSHSLAIYGNDLVYILKNKFKKCLIFFSFFLPEHSYFASSSSTCQRTRWAVPEASQKKYRSEIGNNGSRLINKFCMFSIGKFLKKEK